MSMTLEEMKREVCRKLPNVIRVGSYDGPQNGWQPTRWIKTKGELCWETEGLQVCHEAEKLLLPVGCGKSRYAQELVKLVGKIPFETEFRIVHATYEQKLEALCRVWFPERFR